jgi:EAL domain-containing protein (putative c-di-GMP-specific phosphodiesterase class I)
LNLLAEFQPDFIKLDMELTRNIDSQPVRQAIVSGIVATCRALGLGIIAEGVETKAEYAFLRAIGITLFQGYLFAKPGFQSLPVLSDEVRALLTST